jgi:hypothetical protein
MSPLFKNVALAFVAGFVTSLSVALEADVQVTKAFVVAVVSAALYAGVRAAVGAVKESVSGAPFKVDTEA